MQEAYDFKDESLAIAELLEGMDDDGYHAVTQFKDWAVYDILAHLHLWNLAASWTLSAPEKFAALLTKALDVFQGNQTHQTFQRNWAKEQGLVTGTQLYAAWLDGANALAQEYAQANPDRRVKWGGPDMSVRGCITARQMESWAHAQAVYDVLGAQRINSDRLKNIAHLGVVTYSWSFKVKGLAPILPKPYIALRAPSGALWEWNTPQSDNKVEGLAEEFCQVVTQCRNIADTQLLTEGRAAAQWMDIAQCFAGAPETPPAKGARYRA